MSGSEHFFINSHWKKIFPAAAIANCNEMWLPNKQKEITHHLLMKVYGQYTEYNSIMRACMASVLQYVSQ